MSALILVAYLLVVGLFALRWIPVGAFVFGLIACMLLALAFIP